MPADKLPADKTIQSAGVESLCALQGAAAGQKYSQRELVRAMDLLLRCNQRLVASGLDEALVLQQALVQIVAPRAVAA